MKYDNVSCNQCGRSFGPGDHGFSHCVQHPGSAQTIAELKIHLIKFSEHLNDYAESLYPRAESAREIVAFLNEEVKELKNIIRELYPYV